MAINTVYQKNCYSYTTLQFALPHLLHILVRSSCAHVGSAYLVVGYWSPAILQYSLNSGCRMESVPPFSHLSWLLGPGGGGGGGAPSPC